MLHRTSPGSRQVPAHPRHAEHTRKEDRLDGPRLAAAIAHEIDQPLAAIALHGELALRSLDSNHPASTALRALLAACDDAGAIVRAMRSLAPGTTLAPQGSALQACDLAAAIDAVLADAAPRLARQGVRLALALPALLPAVLSHPVQLRQMLRNLVDNAIDAAVSTDAQRDTPVAPLLSIGASCAGESLLVTVSDNGGGLPPGAPVFEAGFTTKGDGHGLGLSICAAIAASHGGAIRAHAVPAGGARFELLLRRALAPALNAPLC